MRNLQCESVKPCQSILSYVKQYKSFAFTHHVNLCKSMEIHVKILLIKSSFQDLELSIDLCLFGSKYIKMHNFEGENFLNFIEAKFTIQYIQFTL